MGVKVKAKQLPAIFAAWFIAVVLGLTMALLAVGLLGLWVAVGAVVGLGTTLVCGALGQMLFATDFDAVLEARTPKSEAADEAT